MSIQSLDLELDEFISQSCTREAAIMAGWNPTRTLGGVMLYFTVLSLDAWIIAIEIDMSDKAVNHTHLSKHPQYKICPKEPKIEVHLSENCGFPYGSDP